MRKITKSRFWKNIRGQSMTEYALILALVGAASVVALHGLSRTMRIMYGRVTDQIQGNTYDGPKAEDVVDIDEMTKSRDLKDFDE